MSDRGLRFSGIPLGGLGTGSVEFRADGYFHEWQVMNNAPWGTGPNLAAPADASFFGLQVKGDGVNRTVVLGDARQFSQYLNMPYHLPWLEHPEERECESRVPFTRLRFHFSPSLPVEVELEAFSPFIPLDAKNSGLPLAFFTVSLRNVSGGAVEVAVAQALRNLVGYTAPDQPSSVQFAATAGGASLTLAREGLDGFTSDQGTLTLGGLAAEGVAFSYLAHPRQSRDLWEPLREACRLEDVDHGAYSGQVGNEGEGSGAARLRRGLPFGALCQTTTLAPGETQELTFCLAWHFPNMWERDYAQRECPGRRIGHRYNQWFADAGEVFTYGAEHFAALRSKSLQFVQAYYRTPLPRWALEAIAAQFTTLVKASWWDEQGRFGIWEGLGCCGLQTTDITHYGSFPLAQWFPELQKSQMRLSVTNVEKPGMVPHLMPATFGCCDVDRKGRIDLIPQFVLLVWRDVLWTGDLDYARELWPTVCESLTFFQTFDTDGDGLPNNRGPDQTYDQFALKGTSSFVGFLYAGALQAASELARVLGETAAADTYRQRLSEALPKLESQLWTGAFYRLSHDPTDGSNNDGVMADQLNADWFLRQTEGSGLVSDDRARSALRAILAHCTNRQQGYLANCAWPTGGAVTIGRHTADQANTPWTGVEYAVAAYLLLMDMEDEAWNLVRMVRDRYERAGLRFNHIECGEHYYRALSSWTVYLAWAGYHWDGLTKTLKLRLGEAEKSFVLCTPTSWGEAKLRAEDCAVALSVTDGELTVSRLVLDDCDARRAVLTLEDQVLTAEWTAVSDTVTLTFAKPVTISAGQTLRLN